MNPILLTSDADVSVACSGLQVTVKNILKKSRQETGRERFNNDPINELLTCIHDVISRKEVHKDGVTMRVIEKSHLSAAFKAWRISGSNR
jgi:hypothetical protein